MEHVHRWMRHTDLDTGESNHWCVDGDTVHHPEPCQDAADRAGAHANDRAGQDAWPASDPLG